MNTKIMKPVCLNFELDSIIERGYANSMQIIVEMNASKQEIPRAFMFLESHIAITFSRVKPNCLSVKP